MNTEGPWTPQPNNDGPVYRRWSAPSATVPDGGERKGSSSFEHLPKSCQILRASKDIHYWQVQYYAEPLTLEPSTTFKRSGTSSFAQTLKEADDVFYATFPAARPSNTRQWSPYSIMDSPYFEGTGFCIQDEAGSIACPHEYCNSLQQPAQETTVVCVVQQPSFTSELLGAIQPSGDKSSQNDVLSGSWQVQDELMPSVQQHLAPYTKLEINTDIAMPSPLRQMSVDMEGGTYYEVKPVVDNEPPMACLSPPPPHDGLLSTSQEELTLISVKEEFSPIQDLNLIPSETGTWPSLRTRSQSQADSSSSTPSPIATRSPSETMPLTSFGRRSSTLPSPSPVATASTASPSSPVGNPNPSSSTDAEATSPAVMRISPLPANRRPLEKKKTQTLACTFCRHRKIACGPPRSGTTERTCNQCQRRSLECVFPTESRRGMRKKKTQSIQKTPNYPDPANTSNQSAKSEQKNLNGSGPSHRPQEDG